MPMRRECQMDCTLPDRERPRRRLRLVDLSRSNLSPKLAVSQWWSNLRCIDTLLCIERKPMITVDPSVEPVHLSIWRLNCATFHDTDL